MRAVFLNIRIQYTDRHAGSIFNRRHDHRNSLGRCVFWESSTHKLKNHLWQNIQCDRSFQCVATHYSFVVTKQQNSKNSFAFETLRMSSAHFQNKLNMNYGFGFQLVCCFFLFILLLLFALMPLVFIGYLTFGGHRACSWLIVTVQTATRTCERCKSSLLFSFLPVKMVYALTKLMLSPCHFLYLYRASTWLRTQSDMWKHFSEQNRKFNLRACYDCSIIMFIVKFTCWL